MPTPPPASPEAYLAALPPERAEMVAAIRAVINANKPAEIVEGIQYGMIGWGVPHSVHPAGYHCSPDQPVPYASVANQKAKVSLYLFCMYVDDALPAWFAAEAAARGHRLDMGKSCVRFKRMDDIPLELIGEAIRRMPLDAFLARYTASIPAKSRPRRRAKTPKGTG